jgi:predicted ferric reductase
MAGKLPAGMEWLEPIALLRALGLLTGILALAWLLLALILSIRLPGLDQPLSGMLGVWRVHHALGAASLLAALCHPLLLLLASAPQGPAPALALLQPSPEAWPLWSGWLALLLMLIFLAPSFQFFGRPRYQRWKLVHSLAGPAALVALVHGLALSNWLSPVQATVTWGLLGTCAAVAFVWRKGLSLWLVRRPYQIEHVEPLARGIVELKLSPLGRPLKFSAGQFAYLTPDIPGLAAGNHEEHPYTLSSAPAELPTIRVGIKALGDATNALQAVVPGSRVFLEGPYGRFPHDPVVGPQLWIAGGIGVTPFVSAARQLRLTGTHADIHLLFCANDSTRAIYLEELQDIASLVQGMQITPHFFAKEGYLSMDFLRQAVPDLLEREAYVCGPAPLIQLARSLLEEAGVLPAKLHIEAFDLL